MRKSRTGNQLSTKIAGHAPHSGVRVVRAEIVTYIHQSEPPVVHRDLRPANLLLSSAGVQKVTGFGAVENLTPLQAESQRRSRWTGMLG